jgi:hypothetical protein
MATMYPSLRAALLFVDNVDRLQEHTDEIYVLIKYAIYTDIKVFGEY